MQGLTAFDCIIDFDEWLECGFFTDEIKARLKGKGTFLVGNTLQRSHTRDIDDMFHGNTLKRSHTRDIDDMFHVLQHIVMIYWTM